MAPRNNKTRTVGKGKEPKKPRITDDKITAVAMAVVVAIQENIGVYLSNTSTTGGIKMRFYMPDETCEAYLNWGEDIPEEVREVLKEVFEQDTFDDARDVLLAGLAERPSEAPDGDEGTPDTRKRVHRPQRPSGKASGA